MSLSSVRKVYNTYASFYDFVFGRVFHPGRHMSTEIVNKNATPEATVLELGVGTGLSLPLYRSDLHVTGIDISEKMLKKAQERVSESHLTTDISLSVMDAANLDFPDNSFDFIVAMYVASVVPDVDAFLKEITRVCKPNGEIIFVNHFASEQPIMRAIEKFFSPIYKFIGFQPDFSIHAIADYKKFKLIESHKTNLGGYWKILRCKMANA